MLFANDALGVEICQEEARLAFIEGKRSQPRLAAYIISSFAPDTVRLSTKEPNVLNPMAFVASIRESHSRLLTKAKRVSVSLPDSIGRVMLLDLETRFKSREEGADLIRWKLKKSIPFDINEVHLDYQVLQEKETGEVSTLVAFIARQVVKQYEELLLEAGLLPIRIDFTTFNRYRMFAERFDFVEYAAFLTYYGKTLSILIFNGGVLEFIRTKDISGTALDADRIFREINSSLLVYQERYPGHVVNQAFCSAAIEEAETFRAIVAETIGLEPVSLHGESAVTLKDGLTVDRRTMQLLTAPIGAAMRNL